MLINTQENQSSSQPAHIESIKLPFLVPIFVSITSFKIVTPDLILIYINQYNLIKILTLTQLKPCPLVGGGRGWGGGQRVNYCSSVQNKRLFSVFVEHNSNSNSNPFSVNLYLYFITVQLLFYNYSIGIISILQYPRDRAIVGDI